MRYFSFLACALFLACPQATTTTNVPEKDPPASPPVGPRLDVDRVFADPPLGGRAPRALKLAPGGERLMFLKPSAGDSEVLDLWQRDLSSGNERPLLKASALEEVELSEAEKMANERKRISSRGITRYSFCGDTGDRVLVPAGGHLFLVDIEARGQTLRKLTAKKGARLDARCSKRGTYVVFVKGGDLYLIETKTLVERRLTKRPDDVTQNGVAEFIAQEEMGRYTGYWISPDERWLAYLIVDESKVGIKRRPRIHVSRTDVVEQRYPAAGEANAEVRLALMDLSSGKIVPQRLSSDDGYIPRVGWVEQSGKTHLWVQWQSRDQQRLQILWAEVDAARALNKPLAFEQLLEVKDDAWVPLHDDLKFLKSRAAFVYRSDHDGVARLWLYPVSGEAPRAITSGDDPVTELLRIEEKTGDFYFMRATARGKERHLFKGNLDDKRAQKQLTKAAGWHRVSYGESAFVDAHSALFTPQKVSLLNKDGTVRAILDDNPTKEWDSIARPDARFVDVKAADGTLLNALYIAPESRTKPAPTIVHTYGGPTGQLVANRWSRYQPLYTAWSQAGFGVFLVDNRGMAGRDRAFSRAHYRKVGVVEVEDLFSAARQLGEMPSVDKDELYVFGWSYGGFLSARAVLDDASPFRKAASVAPVTDWTLYDTHYTERYLGTPEANPAGYAASNLVNRAGALGDRELLLMHGMADDNVLFQNSLALLAALQAEGADFQFMAYPGKAHGISGRTARRHVFRTITRFFAELDPSNCGPSCGLASDGS